VAPGVETLADVVEKLQLVIHFSVGSKCIECPGPSQVLHELEGIVGCVM